LIGQALDPTEGKQVHVKAANFVFIDPPGWQSEKHPEYPKWPEFLEHVLKPRAEAKPTLMWMPTAGNDGAFVGRPSEKIVEAASLGYLWSAVRWQTAGAEACVLVYNCADDGIRKAICSIVQLAAWGTGTKPFQAVRHS
jgi:hypothetical protein